MANTPSTLIAAMLATPPTKPPTAVSGVVYAALTRFQIAATNSLGHIYPIFRLPAVAVPLAFYVSNSGAVGVNDFALGVYPAGDWLLGDQLPLNQDAFFAGWNFSITNTNERIQFADFGDNLIVHGDSAAPKPGTMFDICFTAEVDPPNPCLVTIAVEYLVGS